MFKNQSTKTLGFWLTALATLVVLAATLGQMAPAAAAPDRQIAIYTPTALPDGRILYTVKANDTLLSISLLTGVPVEQLRALNNLSGDNIIEGQQLLLGLAGPPEVTFTPGPSPTPTPIIPTPTAQPGSGNLCVILFDDVNGDSIRQEEELGITGGQISINNRSGSVSFTTETTAGAEYQCFEGIDEGDYTLSIAVPEGYNPTTMTSYALPLKAGDESYVDFGAQPNSETLAEAPTPTGSGRSPLLGILGGLLIAAAVALAFFAGRMLKS